MLSLIDVLKSKNETLYYDLNRISEKIEPILSRIVVDFPQYTNHDIKHSKTVITRLDTVIPDHLKENFNEYEIFFLLCAAFAHDMGMANLQEIKGYWGDKEETIRENHQKRSCIFVRDYFDKIGLDDKIQGKIIGKICLGHRKEDLHNGELFPLEMAYKEYNINIALLASFLRVADELDITFERTPQIIFENFDMDNELSKDEWEKHLSITGVTQTSNPIFIRCDAICESPNIHRALKKLEVKINDQLDDLPYHMHSYNHLINELPRKFFMEIEPVNYEYYDFKFSLDDNVILNLLMGENLYGSKDECIRELLKNSVDACRFRKETSQGKYVPQICFELTSGNEKLIVHDNGIGMDDYIIEMYFTKIGRSFYRSDDFVGKNLDFNPVNELGIGFLSCFLIADKIIVETKKEGSKPLNIEFNNVSDYFIVQEGDMVSPGTKITLSLKNDFKENINLNSIIKKFARHLEFPIIIVLPDTGEVVEIIETNYPDLSVIFNPDFDKLYEIHHNEDLFEVNIYFFQKEYNGQLYFNQIDFRSHNVVMSYEGIFISDSINFLSEIFQKYCLIDVNLKNDAIKLNLARNGIIYNDNYYLFVNKIEEILCNELFNYFLEIENTHKNPEMVINNFFAVSPSSFVRNDSQHISKQHISKIIKYFYRFLCLTEKGISLKKYSEIINYKSIVSIEMSYMVARSYYNLSQGLLEVFKYYLDCLNTEEETVYLLEPHNIIDTSLKYIFPNLEENSFESLLINDPKYDLVSIESILGDFFDFYDHKVLLTNFRKCSSEKLFIWISGELNEATFFLNKNHKFMKLITDNQNFLSDDQKKDINGWLRTLNFNFDQNSFLKLQKSIIEPFKEDGRIEGIVSEYLITSEELRILELFLI